MFKKKTLKNKKLCFLFILYTLSHIFLYTNRLYLSFLNPFFWFSFLILSYHHDLKFPKKKEIHVTVTLSILFFILYLSSGFLFGFQQNLYHPTIISIFKNLWKIILPIYGMEIMRYELVKSNKNSFLFQTIITLMMILSEINFKAFFLSHNIDFFHYFMSIILPIIAQNILFTYLSFHSYYHSPIVIRLFHEVPKLVLPILPYSNWFMESSFATIQVFIFYSFFQYFVLNKKSIHDFANWITTLYPLAILFSTMLVFFMLGLFPYQAIAILSNSMSPTFQRGDVVIYKKDANISLGDIIVFQEDNQLVVHRVVGIHEYYITKGDRNNTIDYRKIKKEDIKGVYQFHIKYFGYPSIWLNEFFTKENEIARKE